MMARQVSALLLVVCAAALVAVPAVGIGAESAPQVDNNTTDEANGTFGQQVSTFMQTSAVDANASVDSGMWSAAVADSETPETEVTSRAATLEKRLDRLERKAAQLEAKRANGTLPAVAYTAQASSLHQRLVNLRAQVNQTQQTADRVGVNVSKLDTLRQRADNMSGPDVTAVAQTIADPHRGPPAGVPGGQPDDAGPGDRTGPPANGNETGPPPDDGPSNDGSEDAPRNETDSNGPSTQPDGENGTDAGPTDDTQSNSTENDSPSSENHTTRPSAITAPIAPTHTP